MAATALAVPVHYTGFVTHTAPIELQPAQRLKRVLVSAGGGMVGEPLFRAAAGAHRRWHAEAGLTTTVLAGPFAPEPVWAWLQDEAARLDGFEAVRYLPDLRGEMARSAVTVSQCGYNTTMDILRARVPAVVVPYAEGGEDEQRQRAERLDGLGILRCVSPEHLDAARLADAVMAAATSTPAPVTLEGLRVAIGRVAGQRIGNELGQSYAFIGAKGGVGATTAAVNVAASASIRKAGNWCEVSRFCARSE